jgi:hypothetical protein
MTQVLSGRKKTLHRECGSTYSPRVRQVKSQGRFTKLSRLPNTQSKKYKLILKFEFILIKNLFRRRLFQSTE